MPGAKRRAVEAHRDDGDAFLRRQLRLADDIAAGDELGQHHRHGLEGLDLFLGVVAPGAVLHASTPSTRPERRIGTPISDW
jgi:hypothetical protein